MINIFIARGGDNNYIFNVVMWFLPCLFLTEVIFNLLDKKLKSKQIAYFIFVSSLIGFIYPKIISFRLPFCLDIVFTSIVFYYIGYVFRNKIEDKIVIENKTTNMVLVIVLTIIVIILSMIEQSTNMNNLIINNYIIFYFTAIIGFFIVYLVSNQTKLKTLQSIGKNSLYIMCIHEPIKRIVIAVYSKIIGIEGDIIRKNVIHIMIMLILVSLVTMLIIYLFKKFANSLQEKLNNRRISS